MKIKSWEELAILVAKEIHATIRKNYALIQEMKFTSKQDEDNSLSEDNKRFYNWDLKFARMQTMAKKTKQ